MSRGTECLCPRHSFQACLCSEQPWKQGLGLLTTHYKRFGLPKFRAPVLQSNLLSEQGSSGPLPTIMWELG